jgi:hypothetical protein
MRAYDAAFAPDGAPSASRREPAATIAIPCCLMCAASRWLTSSCELSGSAARQIEFALSAQTAFVCGVAWDDWPDCEPVDVPQSHAPAATGIPSPSAMRECAGCRSRTCSSP